MAKTGSACRQPAHTANSLSPLHCRCCTPASATAPGAAATGEAQDTSATETPVEQQYHRQYPGGGHHHAPKHAADVCIIGAGASGIASALRLRQKGYKDVVILERNTFPGGKAVTLKVEPNNTSLYVAALVGEGY